MQRRSFLKGLLAAVCAPLVALKALAVEPKWMPGHAWNYLKGNKRWTQITINTVSSTKQYPYIYKDDKSEVVTNERMLRIRGLKPGWTKADEDMYKDWFSPRIKRTERRINPFLPPEYVKTLKKLGY